MSEQIGIGSTVWVHSEYQKVDMARNYFRIVGETSRSWIVSQQSSWGSDGSFNVPKKADEKGQRWTAKLHRDRRFRVYLTAEELAAEQQREAQESARWKWISAHRSKILIAAGNCSDIAILRQIAALVGYDPEEKA